MREELGEEEAIEVELEEEKLNKAEKELQKLKHGHHDQSPIKEKIEEVFEDAKDCAKHVLGNVCKTTGLNKPFRIKRI